MIKKTRMEGLLGPRVVVICGLLLYGNFGNEMVAAADPGDGSGNQTHFRICVPEVNYSQCQSMVTDAHPKMGRILCVYATDKIACIEKIVKGEADFLPLEPEEIYVAGRFQPDGFIIISEIRTDEFSNRDYRYEPVAVIRKASGISSISDLKGKRSCHTGYGRNAGWKVPFSHLMDKGQLRPFCDELNAPTPERDLNAVAKYFSAACAPGSWVPENEIDKKLKQNYPKLCELCHDPKSCAKDDKYSNYDGALRCLTENGGDVAWTKMDAVEKFFHLKDSMPLEITHDYSLLCWDGSSTPLTSTAPCSWAKRPWKAFVASRRLGDNLAQVSDLQEQITLFRTIAHEMGQMTNVVPEWYSSVLEFQMKTNDVEFNYKPHLAKTITPALYLSKRNFTVTIEKPSCATEKTVKICVRSEVEKLKCTALRMAAMGQRILPGFSCILGEGSIDCAEKVSKGEADVVILSAKEADLAERSMKLVSILSEMEEINVEKKDQSGPYRYAVAVVRSAVAGEFRGNISSLRGKRSCHGSIRSVAGWNAPLSVLRRVGELTGPTCGLTIELAKYFHNQSCVPGALDPKLNMPWLPESLCSLCAGDGVAPGKPETQQTLCMDSNDERYYGDLGALRCLQDNVADVAFLDHVGLHLKPIGTDIKLDRMKLLCPNGTVTELNNFGTCNWGRVSSQKVLARGGEESIVEREDARISLLKAQDLFRIGGKAEPVLRLFGPYYGNKDLLFQDTSVGLCDELAVTERQPQDKLIRDFDYCTTSAAGIISSHLLNSAFSIVVMIVVANKCISMAVNVSSSAFAEATGGSNLSSTGPSPVEYLTTYWVGASTWNIVIVKFMFIYFVVGCVAFFYYFTYLISADKGKKQQGGGGYDDNFRKHSAKSSSVIPPLLRHSAQQILSVLEKLD